MCKILVDLKFTGKLSKIDFSFIDNMLIDMREIRFNYPENIDTSDYDEIINILHLYDYIDFIISTDVLNINEVRIENVFINVGKDNEEVELLLFFDIYDIGYRTSYDNLSILNDWTKRIQDKYNFEFAICQMDNGNQNEYYFDSNGPGPLWDNVLD